MLVARNRWMPWDADQGAIEGTAGVRVYCLPHAGGSARAYLAWARSHAVPGVSFIPVELPGRGSRMGEPPLTSMDEVVEGFLAALAVRPASERFLLFGHSMGAQIAYEAARHLVARGGPMPDAVVVSGARPPGSAAGVSVHDRTDAELLEEIILLGGTPPEILQHQELLAMLLLVMRADLGLLAHYVADVQPTALPCPVLVLAGSDDQLCGPEWVTGWQAMTTGPFRYRVLPGGHFFLHDQTAVVIDEILRTAQQAGGTGCSMSPA